MKNRIILLCLSAGILLFADSTAGNAPLVRKDSVSRKQKVQTEKTNQTKSKTETLPGPQKEPEKQFFLLSENLPLWQVVNELSLFFGKNIVVYKDYKDTKISCSIKDLDLEKSLDLVAWLAGVEWYIKDGIYYIGGNKDFIEVLDNTGIDKSIANVFGSSNVKIIEDKIIVTGTEREVKRISDAIRKMQKKDFVTVRVWGYEISDDVMLTLGVDIDKSIEYAFSWESLITNSYNPVQMLAVSLAMSLEANKQSDDMKLLVDTYITVASGKEQLLNVGEAIDREIYSTNEQGRVFTSGYETTQTGYVLNLAAYKYESAGSWIMDFSLSNVSEQTRLRRNQLIMKNTLVLRDGPTLAGRIIKNSEMLTVSKGIPFLCDIPGIGYLFRVTSERQVRRHVVFFVQKVSDEQKVPSLADGFSFDKFPFLNISNKLNEINRKLFKK